MPLAADQVWPFASADGVQVAFSVVGVLSGEIDVPAVEEIEHESFAQVSVKLPGPELLIVKLAHWGSEYVIEAAWDGATGPMVVNKAAAARHAT